MAITIHQQPQAHSPIWAKLITTATSTASSNDGFKYLVEVSFVWLPDPTPITYYISPNPNGALVFDFANSIRPHMGMAIHNGNNPGATFTGDYANIESAEGVPNQPRVVQGIITVNCSIKEGWNIDGVFTVNDASEQTFSFYCYNLNNVGDPFSVNPSALNGIDHEDNDYSLIMSDLLPTTYDWAPARFLNLSQPNAIYIPAREADFGYFSVRQFDGVDAAPNATKLRIAILPNTGGLVQVVVNLPQSWQFSQLGIWPANLNMNGPSIVAPNNFPNWKAIYFQILNDAEEQKSMSYVMFNVNHPDFGECSCHDYEVVRLAWIGRRGGWEFFNFTMLSEVEYETDQKVAKQYVGNPDTVSSSNPFQTWQNSESEYITYKKVNKFVTCNTDILQPGQWEYLKGLFMSKQVHWINDDGTNVPVIIQDNNYRVRNPKSKAREALTVRFKVAQDQSN